MQKQFGFGRSYSTFHYANLRLSGQPNATAAATDKLTVSVDVTNNSTVSGKEVVQLYVKDLVSSVVVPNIELKGFSKVEIPAGETRTVEIDLDIAKQLGLWNIRMQYVVEPGEFGIFVGSSSLDLRVNATLTVVE